MFNRTFVNPAPVNVHVNQQPHDAADAARLFGECKKRAEAEVAIATLVRFGAHNELTGVRIDTQRTFIDGKLHVRLLFSINGQRFDIQVEDSYEAMTRAVYQEIVCRLFDKVLEKMTTPITHI